LDTITLRRRALGLTQSQLANLSGVSQSYIAKLEAKKIEPSYNKVRAIFEALEKIEEKKEIKVSEIMTRRIVSIQKDDDVQKAVNLMRVHGYSQIPVLDDDKLVGSISERTIIEGMASTKDESTITNKLISGVMDDPFPQIGEEAPVSIVASLLRIYPAVVILKKGEINGIVTKADLLKTLI
jgi:predicted transcriptional regulator